MIDFETAKLDKEHSPLVERCEPLGLHPKIWEHGNASHHTDFDFTEADEKVGELAWFLGTIFDDTSYDYFHSEMTSVDIWRRVGRALRIHGLKITDAH